VKTGKWYSADVKVQADLDNIFTDQFWRGLKYENVYLHDYDSPQAVRTSFMEYIDLYDHRRQHSSLQYQTMASVYQRRKSSIPRPVSPPSGIRQGAPVVRRTGGLGWNGAMKSWCFVPRSVDVMCVVSKDNYPFLKMTMAFRPC